MQFGVRSEFPTGSSTSTAGFGFLRCGKALRVHIFNSMKEDATLLEQTAVDRA